MLLCMIDWFFMKMISYKKMCKFQKKIETKRPNFVKLLVAYSLKIKQTGILIF